ncbi:hypothetical protein Moror_4239 [Moniliophthora roreri MCA 2997]|uniref:Uncharacterized protein n=2 Tax=Moniliophthora roreri TaxID=221103 RepID=V2WUR4_MONRO|nr:hypothetical protein Moror_4239 [Moniliophthora roreri MCA 2997]KAI3602786.1 hypothetical protein WG66_008097 [Moniliophthora roreri]
MVASISPVVSVLSSILLELLVYGFNVAVYFLCVYTLVKRSTSDTAKSTTVLVTLSTLLFMSATAHIAINVSRLVEGYIQPPSKSATIKYLLDLTEPGNVAKQFLLVLVNLFSDMLLTWRVYLIWQRNLMITFIPVFLCIGTFVCGIVTGTYETFVQPGQTIFLARISSWATSQFSLSLAMNVSTTILIASRIWYVTKDIRKTMPEYMKPYWRIIVIVVESASLAAVVQIIQLAFYVEKFPGIYFISDTIVQIVAMAPMIIIVMVGMSGSRKSAVWGTAYATSAELSDMQFQTRAGDQVELPASKAHKGRRPTKSTFASQGTTDDGEYHHDIGSLEKIGVQAAV